MRGDVFRTTESRCCRVPNRRDALAAADAHGGDTRNGRRCGAVHAAAWDDHGARRAHWMARGDGALFHVGLRRFSLGPCPWPRSGLGGERPRSIPPGRSGPGHAGLLRASLVDGIAPPPSPLGTPAMAAKPGGHFGRRPAALAASASTRKAASLMPEALPAVTVPSFEAGAGFISWPGVSHRGVLALTCSSVSKITSPLRDCSVMGTICP